jgi:uncharacterized surface protein with fasciclin (FAS1) repeats
MKSFYRAAVAAAIAIPMSFGSVAARAADDIVDTAVKAGSFNTLVTAVKAAGLVDTLKGKGPFTVFAPTDDAFAKLPKGTVEDLLKPENKAKLKSILLYHVIAGKSVPAKRVIEAKNFKAKMASGNEAEITTAKGPMIDNAKIVKTDVMASNGVIHVIDTVILPKSKAKASKSKTH